MRIRFFARPVGFPAVQPVVMALGISAAILSGAVSVSGQASGVAQNKPVAKPWPPNRLPDGQPDVQGTWGPVNGGTQSLTNPMYGAEFFQQLASGRVTKKPSRIVDPPDGQVPYQPWAAAKQKQQAYDWEHPTKPEHIDSQSRCMMQGVPRPFYLASFRVLQPAGSVVFIWDTYKMFRVVPLDGHPHVGPNLKLWMGDSRGHWEGNTLVIDVTNLNAKFRLSIDGEFFSDKVHIVERLNFMDASTMNYEATIEDPTVFTRPWTIRVAERRLPDEEAWESACHEGERSSDLTLITDTEKK